MQPGAMDLEVTRHPAADLTGSAAGSKNGSHKLVPATFELRTRIRSECTRMVAAMDRSRELTRDSLKTEACKLLDQLQLSPGFLGWTMVLLFSEFWRDQVLATPHKRRLLLLPEKLPTGASETGNQVLEEIKHRADALGIRVLSATATPTILQCLMEGSIDAVFGVAGLDLMEKAIDNILLAGIPACAVPLLSTGNSSTNFDTSWIEESLDLRPNTKISEKSKFQHLLQITQQMFEPTELARLLPSRRNGHSEVLSNGSGRKPLDPLSITETIAHDFLARGGKYARPFITLAAYDAMVSVRKNNSAPPANGRVDPPESVRRVALSIETFHKASLIHDDIEDSDDFRYGQPALHKAHGLSTAINIGDYMIGLGYRLVSSEGESLGFDVSGEILDILADAHLRLSEGQGAELMWRDALHKRLTPQDALRIYSLKTSPAFEAALLSGVRCAGPLGELANPLKQFCEHLGIAFQILNDLKDWQTDDDNKLASGLDALGGRPTLLWALAYAGLPEPLREELLLLTESTSDPAEKVSRVHALYESAHVFEQAHELVERHRREAVKITEKLWPESLQRLLRYLLDAVLSKANKLG